uniref:USP domain-containing protein n=1 Tax=Knipowitschia caucasica TaxID=637954 RepID=A0AAV2KPB2_KNICA
MSRNGFDKKEAHFQPSEVSGVKYYGLVNQGATGFLNSVLQVLYTTQVFRERITSHIRNDPETKHIDRELNDLFLKLELNVAHTNNITDKLEISNVNVQRDAAEVYEKILRQTSPEASQMFRGKLTYRNTCQECHVPTESGSGFWLLPLSLSNNEDYSVERGILDFFHSSHISGDDQMYCETCDDKRDAVLETEITHPPEVLVLLLKCFDFDQTCKRYKTCSSVDVPMVLNVQNQTYELHAIVEHKGGIGRYIATIRSSYDGRWYTFDDRYVTLSRNQYFQYCLTERFSSAYLLFYQKRKAASYHGLLNLGATCYLNCILQVLFRTAAFRERVNNYVQNNPGTEHIDHELTDLFCELEGHWTYTYKIVKKLKIDNVFEPRDAAENYEKILRQTSLEASQIFHGELENISKCLDCGEEYKSTAGFWHLPLSLVDSADGYSVHRGLQDFFQREREVQMYCEECFKTCNAHTYCSLKLCPEVLVLLMKRFEYDNRHKIFVKNNCAVEVPYSLLIQPSYMYELYACVEHYGDLAYGHYISKIKDDGRWFFFNDLSVTSHIFEEKPTEKSETAYLLFYRRKTDSFNRDVSTARTPQEEHAIAEQNTKDNEKDGEDGTQDNNEKRPDDHEGSPHGGISENRYMDHLDQQFDQHHEEGSYIGAQALAEVENIRACESLMDIGNDQDDDEDRCAARVEQRGTENFDQ